MNTKILMTSSALFLGATGLILSFLPEETINYLNIENNAITILFIQLTSALFLGFAILNWMAKGSLIGGIYNKPIAISNLMHFSVGSIAQIKMINQLENNVIFMYAFTAIYLIFALGFVAVFRINPIK